MLEGAAVSSLGARGAARGALRTYRLRVCFRQACSPHGAQRNVGATVPDFASLHPDYQFGEPRCMARFFIKHLLFLGLTLGVVSFLVFVVTELTPGDVARKYLGAYATQEQVDLLTR